MLLRFPRISGTSRRVAHCAALRSSPLSNRRDPQPPQQTAPAAAGANQPAYPATATSTSTYQTAARPTYQTPQTAPAPAAPSNYQRLVVRTQSPYQPATAQNYSQPGGTRLRVLSTGRHHSTDRRHCPTANAVQPYAAPAYGGQTVGATGPNAVAAGATSYPVRQAAITEPQIPPTVETLPPPPGRAAIRACSGPRFQRPTGLRSADGRSACRCSRPIRTSRPFRRCRLRIRSRCRPRLTIRFRNRSSTRASIWMSC